ncbi:hypothetical protein [Corynebacterium pelargi]|uniref:Uncharacterized protein n=1 Tax=Corynebacterium pelargi TaxID=1471400 RepID=A0A410WBK8_9CORY|nr:hypothetical protein [Corynebacterium pelargi]QAU53325.1 hypothetical protein CPELA_10380 [Corynebacterium pelargi]GGG73241.1 hypothetical protein GCM10007338_08100 [Corynebacterium pelargi]
MKIRKIASAALLSIAVSVAGAGLANADEVAPVEAPDTAVSTEVEAPATEAPADEAEPTEEAPAEEQPTTPVQKPEYSSSDKANAFSSEITPDNATSVFGKIVDLVAAILGFVAKVA